MACVKVSRRENIVLSGVAFVKRCCINLTLITNERILSKSSINEFGYLCSGMLGNLYEDIRQREKSSGRIIITIYHYPHLILKNKSQCGVEFGLHWWKICHFIVYFFVWIAQYLMRFRGFKLWLIQVLSPYLHRRDHSYSRWDGLSNNFLFVYLIIFSFHENLP